MKTGRQKPSNYIFWSFLAVLFASVVGLTFIVKLGQIDYQSCVRLLGTTGIYERFGELSIHKILPLIFAHLKTIDIVFFLFFLTAFVPLIWSFLRAQTKIQQICLFITLIVLAALIYLSFPNPSELHDCDRKGVTGEFLAILVPLKFFLPAIFLAWCANRLSESLEGVCDGK